MEYKGLGVSAGRALGITVIFNDMKPTFSITRTLDKKDEMGKVSSSILNLIKEYEMTIKSENNNPDIIELAKTYKTLLSSPSLYDEISNLIIDKNYSAVRAVEEVFIDRKNRLYVSDNNVKDHTGDIRSLKQRIINKILGVDDKYLSSIDYDFILVSKEVTPAMLSEVNPKYIKGIISEIGSQTSHVAILARDIGIPAVFSISNADTIFKSKELIYVDGNKGIIINELDSNMINSYQQAVVKYEKINDSLQEMLNKRAQTLDGKSYEVTSNVGDINDLSHVIELKPDGVGLLRSEFIFLDRDNPPSEDSQFNIYKSFAVALKNKPLIIRTIDIGGDKKQPFFDIPAENNPCLGYRAIRYCLDHKDLFKTQLRAILRASNYGNVMIMYPMISSLEEVHTANAILRETMAELDEEEVLYDEDIRVGIMVEVPSVAATADLFIDEVDFFSIGSNDLVQYTMAVDRTNASINKLYDAYNPAVIRLIKRTIDSKKDGKFVSICGEVATDPLYIILLVGLGIDEFSVNSKSLLRVKKKISLLNYEECRKIVEHILTLRTGTKIKAYLEAYAKEVFGMYMD